MLIFYSVQSLSSCMFKLIKLVYFYSVQVKVNKTSLYFTVSVYFLPHAGSGESGIKKQFWCLQVCVWHVCWFWQVSVRSSAASVAPRSPRRATCCVTSSSTQERNPSSVTCAATPAAGGTPSPDTCAHTQVRQPGGGCGRCRSGVTFSVKRLSEVRFREPWPETAALNMSPVDWFKLNIKNKKVTRFKTHKSIL